MSGMSEVSRAFANRFSRRGRQRKKPMLPALASLESLEQRLALFSPYPVEVFQIPTASGPTNGLEIRYSQPDPGTGVQITADQHVVIDIDRVFPAAGAPVTRVNVYASTNPAANASQPGTAYINIDYIRVVVPNYDSPGTNNNSLTIKGIGQVTDRIIVSGSGRTAAGRWSDESGAELQVAFDIEGIDDLTVTAGGVVNVSGAFTNDTGDASIHAIGEIAERSSDQQTATVIVGETTPVDPSILPHPRLVSDFVEIVGAELDIYSDILATRQVILRAAESAPEDSRSNLVLPYDITVTDPLAGVVELHSTRNITQLQSSTIIAHKLVAVSNNSNRIPPATGLDANPWNIDLGSVNNDFNEIALGMIAAPGDEADPGTQGRIGVRDIDDLTVADFGILASTGMVTLRTGGQLDVNSAIQATGLTIQSDFGVLSSPAGIMKIGDLGITIDAANAANGATGEVTLNGRISVGSGDFTKAPDTRIRSRGVTTITGGIASPQKGTLLVEADEAIVVDAPVQFGSTQLDVNSTNATVFDGDIRLVSNGIGSTGITIRNKPGNEGGSQTLRATEGVSLESTGNIVIEGAVLSGSVYGNPANLTETAALPSITVKTSATVSISSTGSLRTVSYETDPDATTNPLVGLISLSGASQVTAAGELSADGAIEIGVVGDVSLSGPVTARENVIVETSAGSIDVQGAVTSTGGTYTAAVAAGSQREPNVILSAPSGSIATSGAGTLRAGTLTAGGGTTFGTVTLDAQQDVQIGAAIDTPGIVEITSTLGEVSLVALLRNGNGSPITIEAGNGVVQADQILGRIVTDALVVTNTGAAGGASDIDLQAINNQIKAVTATNFTIGGNISIRNAGLVSIGTILAQRDEDQPSTVTLASTNGMTQTGPIQANALRVINTSASAISLTSVLNNVDLFAADNPTGAVSYTDADDFETGVNRGGPLGVEVAGDAVTLSSVAPFSTVRVVSGLRYRTLSIAAGTLSGATVGTVEFVTTSEVDNTNGGPFGGTLRDMIRYARSNSAVYTVNGAQRKQPMALVFDEAGYPVEEITVTSNIPVINVPLQVLGSRLEESVEAAGVERLGIQGMSAVARGLTFGRGSEESLVESLALHGFSMGTSLFVVSGRNTFQNLRVGMNAAGVASPNRIGLLLTSPTSVNNLVGGLDLDDGTENRFVANRAAAIFIDGGASGNRVYGNVIGDETGARPEFANGDGVRIRASGGNLIGTAESSSVPSAMGNVIANNLSSGVFVLGAMAGTMARANRIQNNLIFGSQGVSRPNTGAGAGILVSGSAYVEIGGASGFGNTLVGQGAGGSSGVAGVRIVGSTNVRVLGNAVGVDVEEEVIDGNSGSGLAVEKSSNIEITGGNAIGANGGDGITISDGSTGVLVTDNLVGLFANGAPAGNAGDGISIRAAIGNTIGAGNVIAYNRDGVRLADGRAATRTAGNRVFGSELFANSEAGVRVVGGSNVTVGSATVGETNWIRNNGGDGVRIEWSAVTGAASGHLVQGNFVGTDRNASMNADGNGRSGIVISGGIGNTIANGNVVMNNAGHGIELLGGSANVVGGTTEGSSNELASNGGSGVVIGAAVGSPSSLRDAKDHSVMGNVIRGNAGHGVEALAGTLVAAIGQKVTSRGVTGSGNVIEGNLGYGVRIAAGAQRVSTQGNSVFENLAGAIAIASGANRSAAQSISLTRAEIRQPSGGGEQLVVTGSLANGGYPQQQYSVDIYANLPDEGDYMSLTGYQARRFLGRATVTTNAQGVATFEFRITAPIEVGEVITATATALRFEVGSSSVLSNAVTADLPGIQTPRY